MKRILYLDTLRGFLILYVVFIHAVLLIIFQANYEYIDILPTWLLALMFPLLIIAMWGPMFSMMSATTNTYLVYHELEKGNSMKQIMRARMSSYILIVLVHFINMSFFIHYIPLDDEIYRSLIAGSLETGQLTLPNVLMFLNSGTLLLIGLSGLLINMLLLVLWRKNKQRNIKTTVAIFIGLAILFLVIRPFLYPFINNFIIRLVDQSQLVGAILLSWLFLGQFGLIPMAAVPFFGVIFGLLLATNSAKRTIIRFGVLSSVGMLVLSLLFIGVFGIPDLTLPYWPVSMVAFNLMLMIIVTTILISRYEFASRKNRINLVKRTMFLRRFSMITLSMFVFESIIAVLWSRLFMMVFLDPFPFNVGADLLFIACVLGSWYVIARFWEKIDFKYSIEWFLIQIMAKITGRSSQKLNVQSVLYHPVPFDGEENIR